MRPLWILLVLSTGCAGGAPLLHPAHVLRSGKTSFGAGFSGQMSLTPKSSSATDQTVRDFTEAPGVAPWVSARIGVAESTEAGLTYTGRGFRLDGRYAWAIGAATLSTGLGASAILARRPDQNHDGVYGGGFDLPVLLGVSSKSDLYSLWFGPRGGFERIVGREGSSKIEATHTYGGFVLGTRVGFRHVHAAVEIQGTYRNIQGSLGNLPVHLTRFTWTPATALTVTF